MKASPKQVSTGATRAAAAECWFEDHRRRCQASLAAAAVMASFGQASSRCRSLMMVLLLHLRRCPTGRLLGLSFSCRLAGFWGMINRRPGTICFASRMLAWIAMGSLVLQRLQVNVALSSTYVGTVVRYPCA